MHLSTPRVFILFLYAAVTVNLTMTMTACKKDGDGASAPSLYDRGRLIYVTRCAVCHNADPDRPGSVGPEIFGSSKELIEARVLRGEYPPTYTPKRNSIMMPAMPDLKKDIDAIHEFLNKKP